MITVTIGDTEYNIMQNTLNFEDDVEQRSTCSFNVRDLQNEYDFVRGQKVVLKDDNDNEIFAGYLEQSEKMAINNVGNYIHRIDCSDMHYLADKRLVILAEENELAGDIVKKIVDDKLSEEGVNYSAGTSFEQIDDAQSDFEEGELTNVIANSEGLKLEKTGEDIEKTDTTTSDFEEGALADVVAVDDGLELENNPALEFGGDTDRVDVGNLGDESALSFSLRFRTDTDNSGKWRYVIISTPDGTIGDSKFALSFREQGDGGLDWSVNGNHGGIDTNLVLDDNEWHHIVGTYDGSECRLYVDNQLEGSYSDSGSVGDTSTAIGADPQEEKTGRGVVGTIDEVKKYDKALSESEIDDLYNDKEVTDGLVNNWKMNEGEGSTVEDSAGDNDGDIEGATWIDNYISWNLDGTGTRTSEPLDLTTVGELESSLIEWEETLNGETITIETSIDDGDTWQECTNGEPIPDLPTDLDGVELLVRATLETEDTTETPVLEKITISVTSQYYSTGDRRTPAYDLSDVIAQENSLIEWEETLNGQTVTTETRLSFDEGSTWGDWQVVSSGDSIPDLPENTEDTQMQIRQTLETDDTGETPVVSSLTAQVDTLDFVADGANITKGLFNYVSAKDAIDALAEKSGFWWKIDSNKNLHFQPFEAEPAEWELTPDDIQGIPTIKQGNPLYRNAQYIKGGVDTTDEQTDTERGDGDKRTFPTGFSIVEKPTIEVDRGDGFEEESVGIKGLDEDKKWYWSKGENTVTQDRDEPVLSDTDKVRIKYIGQFKIVGYSEDRDAIINNRQVEGDTSGIVEDAVTEGDVEGRDSAIEAANGKLLKYAKNSTTLSFVTRRSGLQAGKMLTVNDLDETGIETGEELLITSVSASDNNSFIEYDVKAVKGPRHESWSEMFSKMVKRAESTVTLGVGESDVLTIPIEFEKTWTESENPNIFREVYPADDLYPGDDVRPMFKVEDRVKILAWYDDDEELGRKEYTQQEGADTDTIETLTYLGPNDANETITHLGWIGGWKAKEDEPDSGVIVDKQSYEETKTEDQAWQIDKIDYKWE